MLLFSVLAAATAPGLALLMYFYLKDRYDSEPLHMVIKVFLLGFLVVLPVMIFQRGLLLWLGDHTLIQAFGISAGVEEFLNGFCCITSSIIIPSSTSLMMVFCMRPQSHSDLQQLKICYMPGRAMPQLA